MKNKLIRILFVVAALSMGAEYASAQKRVVKKRSTATRKTTTTKNTNTSPLPAPGDTTKPVEANIDLGTVRKSLRNDNAVEDNLVKDRTPLEYENIRVDDAVYRQRLWREINIHEKMNMPFTYKAEDDNGNQRFIYILLGAIKSGEINAFNPIDDRFTTPMTVSEITKQLVGGGKTIQVTDWAKDPDGSKGIMKDSTIVEEFNPDSTIEKYWVKEDVIFDKESSRLHTRILGIAPLLTKRNQDGSFRDVTPLFWVYYPDLRPMLAKHEAYNSKNAGARMSWEELFESHMFASRIVKSTLDNPYDQFIAGYIKDPILRLLEGDNIKERIFNYEQDLWSY